MIARVWFGRTEEEAYEAYVAYLEETGVRDLSSTEGNRGVFVLRRRVGDQVEFGVLSLWDSIEDVRRFAGPEPERAVYYPEDGRFLVDLPREVAHYEVVAEPVGDGGRAIGH